MAEMVERVARSMCIADDGDPDGTAGVRGICTPYWTTYEALARAAIEAMRDPTEEMCVAAGEYNVPDDHHSPSNARPLMIDSALKQPGKWK